ncbi:MAG TPA: FAD:protein FMN transferase [Planctomycetota bacterium]|nr:FAD:protein FMN transferase [Planctomycetota bacterium]HRR80976.1 FAD:protein FMN transferase [Planctomycetota bacterium]HRT94640.1 FAD:protein FMN transferase [Planctomycetota bacterium]
MALGRCGALWMTALALVGCSPPVRAAEAPLVRVSDGATPMGTYMVVTVYAPDEAAGRAAIAAAFARVEEVEAATSHYREASDLSKLNRSAGGPPIAISRHLWTVLRRAREISEETGGAFDVTVGPLVELWKRTWKQGTLPTEADVAAARALVDYRLVRVAADEPRAQLLKQGMRLDLGAIGKGYAADQAIAALRERGIAIALVAVAGDIRAIGAPPGRQWWLVGIRDPARPDGILPAPLGIRDRSVSTSGDYEQFGMVAGRRESHILDPRSAKPVEGVRSVTVVASDSITADAYATALSVLGPDAAIAFAEKRADIEALVIYERDGKLHTARSKGFEKLEVTPAGSR